MPLEIRGAHFLIRSAQLVRKTRLEIGPGMLSFANATRCSFCSDSTDNLFAADREFCGGLSACLFVLVLRLAVKIFGGFTATSAKIQLGGYGLRLVGLL